jgi:SAM-dependent methyltransferase
LPLRAKEIAKRYLGGTGIWRALTVLRYHWRTNRAVQFALSFVPGLAYRQLQSDAFYDGRYFDAPKDPEKESGYGDVYSDLEDFAQIAELAGGLFRARRVLDVGCAKGFQVRALQQAGLEAWGFDISDYAIRAAPEEVRPWLKVGSCQCMDFEDAGFDLVLVMETLEHIPPTDLKVTLKELYRVSSRWVLATIPSDGLSRFGQEHALRPGAAPPSFFEGIVDLRPFRSLEKDQYGLPLHGHVSIASQDRWTELFSLNGFARRGEPERRMAGAVDSIRRGVWIPYVFEKAVNPTGAGARIELWQGRFTESGGVWSSRPITLPAGTHFLLLNLRLEGRFSLSGKQQRCLHARAISTDGNTLHGTRLFSRREVRSRHFGGELAVSLPCACPDTAEVVVQLQAEPGLRLAPAPGAILRTHVSLCG